MFLAHSFRLRDPWQCECGADGAVRWSRVFHLPTGLEPDDALWLVCSQLPPGAVITVNGHNLTEECHSPRRVSPAHQYEVTPLLAEANRVEIEVPSDPSPVSRPPSSAPPFPYDVRLGIVGHS